MTNNSFHQHLSPTEGIAFTELKENFWGTVKTNNPFHQHLSLDTIGRCDYSYRIEGEIWGNCQDKLPLPSTFVSKYKRKKWCIYIVEGKIECKNLGDCQDK